MAIPAPHLRDVVTAYVSRHPEEQALLQPLLDRIGAGCNVTDRGQFDGHITTSGVVINDADDVLLIHHLVSGRWIQPGGHLAQTDATLDQAVRREIAEETGVTDLEPYGDDIPVHIDVQVIEARPDANEPAHVHYDVRYLFRARGAVRLHLQADEVGAARWRPPSELGDPILRARVLASLGLPREDRAVDEDPYCTLVVITDPAATKVLMHLRDDKPGLWAPGTWAPVSGGAEPHDADPHATGVRELYEETGLESIVLTHLFSTHTDGYPRHVFHGAWDGDPHTLSLNEGQALDFIARDALDHIPMHPSSREDTDRVLDLITPRQPPYGYGTLALISNRHGQLLMHLRDDRPGTCWPETWSPNGGKPEPADAGPRGTIVREVEEEVGLTVPLTHLFTHTADDGHLTYVFRSTWDGDPDTLTLTEGRALAFVDPKDLGDRPMSPLARYAALRGLAAELEDQAHAEGIHDLVAGAIIVHDGSVLVVRRNPDDYLGGTWETPASRLEKSESIIDALHREITEETGLTTAIDRYAGHFDYTNSRGRTSRQFVFTCTPEKPGPVILSEHDRYLWVREIDQLPPTTPELRTFLERRWP
ncbi:NUDIX domain-containing protein [Streptomyces albogriseolus]|uniref:NUDIX domain-containing protein n=1 Tax=Streptomyces albogriseolus TaxID=1887 RepID=UPI0019CEA2C3|nr:NUDIX domain-containing protein [Streptomyces sp.]